MPNNRANGDTMIQAVMDAENKQPRDSLEGKSKRGRPSVMIPGELERFQAIWPDITTRRGILNKHYEIEAFGVIRKMQSEGVTGPEFISDMGKQKSKSGILRELGRLNEDTIRAYAPALCEAQKNPETRRTVREWEGYLRLMRLYPGVIDKVVSETVSENGKTCNEFQT